MEERKTGLGWSHDGAGATDHQFSLGTASSGLDQVRGGACGTGHEKLLRIFNVDKPEADPVVFPEASGKIRCVAWSKSDDLLLTSDLDHSNIT